MAITRKTEPHMILCILKECERSWTPLSPEVEARLNPLLTEIFDHGSLREKAKGMQIMLQCKRMQLAVGLAIFNSKHNPYEAEQPTIKVIVGVDEKALLERIEPATMTKCP